MARTGDIGRADMLLELDFVVVVSSLIRKERMGLKACKNLPGVGMRLHVTSEGDTCKK